MAKIKVNNITLAYETLGEGKPIVFTPGMFLPRDNWAYLQAGRFSKDYKVLLWDRRNTGMSDIGIEDSVSEWHLWTDDLHNLLNAIDMSPAYIAGGSAGNVLSLLMAYRYPEDVKALVLYHSPTNDPQYINAMAYARYLQFAEVAENQGIQAVIDLSTDAWVRVITLKSDPNGLDSVLSWIAESIAANPDNREMILSMDSNKFASVLRKWATWGQPERFHLAQLSDEEIGRIAIPSLILHGFNLLHPRHTAEDVYGLLPNSEWVEFTDWYSQDVIDTVRESDAEITQKVALSMPIVDDFLFRMEKQFSG